MFGSLIIVFAFILGFALSRASTCTVMATARWVMQGKVDWLVGILIAVCWSAMTLLALRAIFPGQIEMPPIVPINLTLIIASIVMGAGAFLNHGCFIGTIGRISSGNLSYLMTFVGLAFARLLGEQDILNETFNQELMATNLAMESIVFWGAVSLFGGVFIYSCVRIVVRRKQALIALCVMGVVAPLTYVSDPDWSYESWIGQIVTGQGLSQNYQIEFTVLALFAGATLSSVLNGKFSLVAPTLSAMMMCFIGGCLMGLGAKFVPGGNDTLLLWTIPNFAIHGFVAYATMVATVALLVMGPGKRMM